MRKVIIFLILIFLIISCEMKENDLLSILNIDDWVPKKEKTKYVLNNDELFVVMDHPDSLEDKLCHYRIFKEAELHSENCWQETYYKLYDHFNSKVIISSFPYKETDESLKIYDLIDGKIEISNSKRYWIGNSEFWIEENELGLIIYLEDMEYKISKELKKRSIGKNYYCELKNNTLFLINVATNENPNILQIVYFNILNSQIEEKFISINDNIIVKNLRYNNFSLIFDDFSNNIYEVDVENKLINNFKNQNNYKNIELVGGILILIDEITDNKIVYIYDLKNKSKINEFQCMDLLIDKDNMFVLKSDNIIEVININTRNITDKYKIETNRRIKSLMNQSLKYFVFLDSEDNILVYHRH